MGIVDYDYYSETYIGEEVDETDFPRYEARAEGVVKQITHGRVTADTFPALAADLQEAVLTAICAQIEYYAQYGLSLATAGLSGASFSVGKVSVTGGLPTGRASMVAPGVRAALEQTGLLNPQVDTISTPYLPFGRVV